MLPDLRFALRGLARNPGFTAVAVLVLALGFGANTAIFSAVHAALLRPLPYPDSGRLVLVWDQLRKLGLERFPAPFAHYHDYRARNAVLEDLAAFAPADFNLTGPGAPPERVRGLRVSANWFPMLGLAAPPDRENVVLVSHDLWRRRFGADPSLTGRTLRLDGAPYTVAAVLPPGFAFPAAPADLYVPLVFPPDPARNAGAVQMLARLKPGVTLEQAQADLRSVAAAIERQYHPYRGPQGQDAGYNVAVFGLRDELYGRLRRPLLVLLGAVGLVFLVACANVANLLLAQAAGRAKEIAIRQALGAARRHLLRQMLAESAVLSLLGAAAGLLLANASLDALAALAPPDLPPVALDPRVIGFALLLAAVTTAAFTLLPAWRAPASPRGRLAASLVAAEVALSLALLIAAGLLLKSFLTLEGVNPGFQPERVLSLRISLPREKYPEPGRAVDFFRRILERLDAMPGVAAAGVTSRLPLTGGPGGDPFSIEGRPYRASGPVPQVVQQQVVSPGYFRAMGIRLVSGRLFTGRDLAEAEPVVIINETLARGFWPDPKDPPLGKRVVLGAPRPGAAWMTIVGVAADVQLAALDRAPLPQMYLPYSQAAARSLAVVLRAPGDAASLAAQVRAAVASLDPEQPVYDVRTMEQRLEAALAVPRFQTLLVGSFAVLALALAAAGVYAVVSCVVARRTREIGIRMALGAEPAGVMGLVLRQGMAPVAVGLVAGVAGGLAFSRVLTALLFGVSARDLLVFTAAPLVLAAAALLACCLPARRATRIDPVAALRQE